MEGERVQEEAFLLPRGRLLLLFPARRGSCLSSPGVLGVTIGLDKLWLNFLPPFPPFVPCLCTIFSLPGYQDSTRSFWVSQISSSLRYQSTLSQSL